MLSVSDFVEQIHAYEAVLSQHSLRLSGSGVKPWSNRHSNGSMHVDVRKIGWTVYDLEGNEIADGASPDALRTFLCRTPQ